MASIRKLVGSLDNLVAFEAAARLGNFSRAADELSVAQPAISRRIHQLEAHLGVTLFLRRGTRISCTPAGAEFYKTVTSSLDAIEMAARKLQPLDDNTVSLRVNVAAASLWIMPALAEFYETYPEIRLHLVCVDEMPEFNASNFDLEIRFCKDPWPNHDCYQLLDERVYPVASPDYLASRGFDGQIDLSQAPLLQTDNFISPLMDWRNWTEVTPKHVIRRFTTYAMVLKAARMGHGVALGWHYYVQRAIARGELVALPYPERGDGYFEYLIANPKSASRKSVSQTKDWLLALAKRERQKV